jgi:aminobenzoyl-glutamate transport protein
MPKTESRSSKSRKGFLTRFLDGIERVGNKLPDPAILFFVLLLVVWVLSAILAEVQFTEVDPRTQAPIQIQNLLSGQALAAFLANMITVFVTFPPLGLVLVAMLGVGVAEHSGYIGTGLRFLMNVTPRRLITPVVILVAVVSHTATDAGYVLVIPLAGVIFYVAGRHPLAGIAAAFAGVSGGFSANFIPSGIDPLLQGFTQAAGRIIDPDLNLNPLNNWFFTSASTLLIVFAGWYITDRIVEPRLQKSTPVDEDMEDKPVMEEVNKREKRSFYLASGLLIVGIVGLYVWAAPADSPLRSPEGEIAAFNAPLMRSIVPLIFILFLLPGVLYGFLSGHYTQGKDVITGMSKAMGSMSYYIVMAFFAAIFIDAFAKSNIGALLALKGAAFLQQMQLPGQITVVGVVILTSFINLFVGSASAKWALISPIVVPMLMQLKISPDLTQAAYRVGDSVSNIITPLMPYFPLVVVFAQRYVRKTGIGTLVSVMLPYAVTFFVLWTAFLLVYWALGIPLGLQATYTYP